MRARIPACLLATLSAVLLLVGCEDSLSPTQLDATDFVGTWTLDVESNGSCLPNGATLYFVIDRWDAEAASRHPDGYVIQVYSKWGVDVKNPDGKGLLTGKVNLNERTFELSLWYEYKLMDRAIFRGRVDKSTGFWGTYTDYRHPIGHVDYCSADGHGWKGVRADI